MSQVLADLQNASSKHHQVDAHQPSPPQVLKKIIDFYKSIPRYTLRTELGSGSFGKVYLATEQQSQKFVALKVTHGNMDKSSFFNEAQTCKRIQLETFKNMTSSNYLFTESSAHELVPFKRKRQDDPVLVQRYLPGGDFYHRYVQRGLEGGGVKFRELKRLHETLSILLKAAKQNIVHTDLKPGNIVDFKLIDWGAAISLDLIKSKESCEFYTDSLCTLRYRPPEGLITMEDDDISWPVDGVETFAIEPCPCFSLKFDVWSLGVSLYEMVCSEPLFKINELMQSKPLVFFLLLVIEEIPIPDFIFAYFKDWLPLPEGYSEVSSFLIPDLITEKYIITLLDEEYLDDEGASRLHYSLSRKFEGSKKKLFFERIQEELENREKKIYEAKAVSIQKNFTGNTPQSLFIELSTDYLNRIQKIGFFSNWVKSMLAINPIERPSMEELKVSFEEIFRI